MKYKKKIKFVSMLLRLQTGVESLFFTFKWFSFVFFTFGKYFVGFSILYYTNLIIHKATTVWSFIIHRFTMYSGRKQVPQACFRNYTISARTNNIYSQHRVSLYFYFFFKLHVCAPTCRIHKHANINNKSLLS